MATFIKPVPKCALPLKTVLNSLPTCSWCSQSRVLFSSGDVSAHVLQLLGLFSPQQLLSLCLWQ